MADHGPVGPIRLANGVVVGEPLTVVRHFIRVDGSYRAYDLAPVLVDARLTEADVRVANRLMARMSASTVASVIAARSRIEPALAAIEGTASLIDDDIPWRPLADLYRAFDGIAGIGISRATKIAHKKRPALVPILDAVVEEYLTRFRSTRAGSGLAERGIELTRAYRQELLANLSPLRAVRALLEEDGILLTECRLLDIVVWAYSGTYAPVWQRASGRRLGSVRTAEPDRVAAVGQPTAGLDVFVDDDLGYASWLEANRGGFVLNTTRRPTAGYIKLHRATCGYVAPVGGRRSTFDYAKICGPTAASIGEWSVAELGKQPDRCPRCAP